MHSLVVNYKYIYFKKLTHEVQDKKINFDIQLICKINLVFKIAF